MINGTPYPPANAFDSSLVTVCAAETMPGSKLTVSSLGYSGVVDVEIKVNGQSASVNGQNSQAISGETVLTWQAVSDLDTIEINGDGARAATLFYVKVSTSPAALTTKVINGDLLVDSSESLNLRVNQVMGDTLIGVPNQTINFTTGKYLRVPEQRVAPWVLYGNDPTSLIDHLRQS